MEIDTLRRLFVVSGYTLPLRPDPKNAGLIEDATGTVVCVVDEPGVKPDATAAGIAEAIVYAINAAAGFPPSGMKGTV